jgi:cobyrinic acid a,c-diamide synthase
MMMEQPKAILIAGTHSGVGKTTVTMGLLAALSNKMIVQGFKVGPDYIDTAYHSFITGLKSRNLDNFLMEDASVLKSFHAAMQGKELGIIEGAMGLYDGSLANPEKGSSASISKVIGCPVVLVIDGSGMALSVAALVKGYCDFDTAVSIQGVILNRVNSQSHYAILKKAIETHTKVTCLGYLPETLPQLPSRHLGLVPSCEIEDLEKKMEELATCMCKTLDLEAFIKIGLCNERITKKEDSLLLIEPEFVGLKVGIAYDEAFNFYYEDNIDLFREHGAEIVFFSPLNDANLPDELDFLYLGGGYPEQFAGRLASNTTMRDSVYQALEAGMPYYGECGGFMYLNQELIDFDGTSYPMVGWFEGCVRMTKKLKGFGYKTLSLQENCVLGPKNLQVKCHEFHHSEVDQMGLEPIYCLNKVRDGVVTSVNRCGYQKGNGVAGYPHIHFYGNTAIPIHLLTAAKKYNATRLRR